MGRPGYPAEFRRKVLDLLADGPQRGERRARSRDQRSDDLQRGGGRTGSTAASSRA